MLLMLRVKSAFALLLTKVTKLQLLATLLSEAASPPTADAVNGIGSDDLKRTISAMVGKGSISHNSRKFHAVNTDPARSHLNVCYCNTDIKAVYHELFDAALLRYNEKQKRADRRIEDYYEKIRSGKQEKAFHELILQIGNREDMAAITENGELARQILDEYYRGFQARNPNLRVFSAHLHMDEATPHLHIDFVPYMTGSKRGLDTRVSLKQALAEMGFKGEGKFDNEWNRWVQSEKEKLAEVMLSHGIEWEQKDTHREHLSVQDYKKEQRLEEIAELEQSIEAAQERMEELAPAVENMETLAEQFSADPELLAPPVDRFESAKRYREKKVVPLLARIVKVLRVAYRRFLELRNDLNDMQRKYQRERRRADDLVQQVKELETENGELKDIAGDFERAKRVIGVEHITAAIQYDREEEERKKLAERQARRMKKHRSHER